MNDYELTCEAMVNGEIFRARMRVAQELYLNPRARQRAEEQLRMDLVTKIVERFPPKISVERVSLSPWRAV